MKIFNMLISPLGTVTSKFGEISSLHKTPHRGLDLAAPENTPIHSPVEGIVTKIVVDNGTGQGLGNGLYIKTDTGYQVVFGHLNKLLKEVGEHVDLGEVVALSGNTGRSTGPHVHIALRDPEGHYIDPELLSVKDVFDFILESLTDLLV